MHSEKFEVQTGQLFAGRYRIEKLLGNGGMGKVYLVQDTILGDQQVALKILHQDLCRDEKHTKRFLREVQITRMVTHPNIVRTFDVGIHEGQLYFTMEYAPGVTLKEKLAEIKKLDYQEVARILVELCNGLSAIHEQEIVHRDLKPGNVIITPDKQVKLTDFGVARPEFSDMTAHNEVVGSVPYMAPEVWVGREISPSADIYALGILTFELLTGELPFKAEAPAEAMFQHLEARPKLPSTLSGDIPPWLDALVSTMLEKDPAKRPDSVEAIRKTIEQKSQNETSSKIDSYRPSERIEVELKKIVAARKASQDPIILDPERKGSASRGFARSLDSSAPLVSRPVSSPNSARYNRKPNYAKRLREEANRESSAEDLALLEKSLSAKFGQVSIVPRLLRAAFFSILLTALVIGPLWSLNRYLWQPGSYAASSLISFLKIMMLIGSCSVFMSMPIFTAATLRDSIHGAFEQLLKFSLIIFLIAGAVLGYHLNSLSSVGRKAGIFTGSAGMVVVAKPSVNNLFEAAFLVPSGSTYKPAMSYGTPELSEEKESSALEQLPYMILLVGYLTVLFIGTSRSASNGFKNKLPTALWASGFLVIGLKASGTYLVPPLQAWLGLDTNFRLPVLIGPFTYEVSGAFILCSVTAWLAFGLVAYALRFRLK